MHDANVSKVDGRLLRIFLTVYDSGSVTKAAGNLDLNQSTISHGIERLRGLLNDPLFVRSGRGIVPTDFSTLIAPTVREIIHLLESIDKELNYDPEKDRSQVAIAANIAEMTPLIRRIHQGIHSQNPHMAVRFIELGSRENTESFLSSGSVDLVVTARPSRYPKTVCSTAFVCDHHVCYFDSAVRGPVASLDDYSDARHGALDFGGNRLSIVALALEEHGIVRDIHLYASSTHALGALMAGTDLVATLGARFRHSALSHLAHCEPPFHLPPIQFDLVWHRRSDASKRNQWIRGIALNAAREEEAQAAAEARPKAKAKPRRRKSR